MMSMIRAARRCFKEAEARASDALEGGSLTRTRTRFNEAAAPYSDARDLRVICMVMSSNGCKDRSRAGPALHRG
jgi:hypothetical protein